MLACTLDDTFFHKEITLGHLIHVSFDLQALTYARSTYTKYDVFAHFHVVTIVFYFLLTTQLSSGHNRDRQILDAGGNVVGSDEGLIGTARVETAHVGTVHVGTAQYQA